MGDEVLRREEEECKRGKRSVGGNPLQKGSFTIVNPLEKGLAPLDNPGINCTVQ